MVSIEWNDSITPKIIGENQVNSSTYKNYVQMIDESELSRLYPGYDAAKSDCEMQLYPIANYFVALNVSGFVLADGSPLNDELTYDIVLDTDHPSTYGAIVWYNPDTNSFVQQLAPNPQLGFTELSYSQKFEYYTVPPAPDDKLHYLDNLGLQRFKANIDENLNEIKRTPVTTSGTGAAYVAQVKGINAANIYMVPVGTSFTMIPHTDSTTVKPTLNVNGLGAREIRVKSMVNNDAAIPTEDKFLLRRKPVDVMFDGTYWVCDMTVVDSAVIGLEDIAKKAEDAEKLASSAEDRSVKLSNDLPVMIRSGVAIIDVNPINDVATFGKLHAPESIADMFDKKMPYDGGDFYVEYCFLSVENNNKSWFYGITSTLSKAQTPNNNSPVGGAMSTEVVTFDIFDTGVVPTEMEIAYTYIYAPPPKRVFWTCDTNKYLRIYNRPIYSMPKHGDTFDGYVVDKAGDIDLENMGHVPSWQFIYVQSDIKRVYVIDKISPISLSNWFAAFSGCEYFDIAKIDTARTINMTAAFSGIKFELNLENFDTSNVTNMSYMFESANVAKITGIENFDTSNVTNMSYMFASAMFPDNAVLNFDTSNVTDMSNMFANVIYGDKLNLSSFDTSNVTDMSNMFANNGGDGGGGANRNILGFLTIYISSKFIVDNVSSSINMFLGQRSLIGGAGTTYNASHTDKTYARIDNPPTEPGYFTEYKQAFAVYSEDDNSLDFYNRGEVPAEGGGV